MRIRTPWDVVNETYTQECVCVCTDREPNFFPKGVDCWVEVDWTYDLIDFQKCQKLSMATE